MRKVTIEDISRETGLSRGTVSRALNDRPDISTKTKLLVLDACKKLNYSPSSAARSLATGRNYAVAALCRSISSHETAECIRGCARAAHAGRYALTLIELPDGPDAAEERIRSLSAERIDGVVAIASLAPDEYRLLAETVGARSLVSLNASPGLSSDVFRVDNREAGALAARRLMRRGVRSCIYAARRSDSSAQDRLVGFRDAWSAAGNDGSGVQSVEVEFGEDLAKHESSLQTIDAVAASDDRLAVAALALLAKSGRQAGRDVQLIGCGDEPIAADAVIPLTTVNLNVGEAAVRATSTLLQRIAGERQDAAQMVAIAPTIVDRSTVGGAH